MNSPNDEEAGAAEVSPFLGWALWVSEIWYSWAATTPCPRQRLHAKARGIVVYDRVLNGVASGEIARAMVAAA